MSVWLSLVLLSSSWTRPIEQTALVWALSLPVFLLLDAIRWKSVSERDLYLVWLGAALKPVSGTEQPLPMPGQMRRIVVCYGPLALLVLYLVLFLFVPAARVPANAVDATPLVEWAYSVIGAWYPADAVEPAHIVALGHARDAAELRHFMAVAIFLSLCWTFVGSGPGRPELIKRFLLLRRPAIAVSMQLIVAVLLLGMFAIFGFPNNATGYLELRAFVPCGMFALSGCVLAWGIGLMGIAADVITVRVER